MKMMLMLIPNSASFGQEARHQRRRLLQRVLVCHIYYVSSRRLLLRICAIQKLHSSELTVVYLTDLRKRIAWLLLIRVKNTQASSLTKSAIWHRGTLPLDVQIHLMLLEWLRFASSTSSGPISRHARVLPGRICARSKGQAAYGERKSTCPRGCSEGV